MEGPRRKSGGCLKSGQDNFLSGQWGHRGSIIMGEGCMINPKTS